MDVEYINESLKSGQKSHQSEKHFKRKGGETLLFFTSHRSMYMSVSVHELNWESTYFGL